MKLDNETLERVGQLSDKADNIVHASTLPLPATMHVEQMRYALKDIREELRQIFFDGGGDPQTWDGQ